MIFQSTLPCGSDDTGCCCCGSDKISIHAPLRERQGKDRANASLGLFQSTLPCGSDSQKTRPFAIWRISIHAPLRERLGTNAAKERYQLFQSTLPCGSDAGFLNKISYAYVFQSTLPCGSDLRTRCIIKSYNDFNPRSPAGATVNELSSIYALEISIHAPLRERHLQNGLKCFSYKISIHAPLRERPRRHKFRPKRVYFNPRSPAGATVTEIGYFDLATISIHAPLRERLKYLETYTDNLQFQSTLPCGSDQGLAISIYAIVKFQSTLPCGSDEHNTKIETCKDDFNPRSPAGATEMSRLIDGVVSISIHAPLRERLFAEVRYHRGGAISIHAPLRERRICLSLCQFFKYFNPRSPAGATRRYAKINI